MDVEEDVVVKEVGCRSLSPEQSEGADVFNVWQRGAAVVAAVSLRLASPPVPP